MKRIRPPRRPLLTQRLNFSTVALLLGLVLIALVAYLLPSTRAQNETTTRQQTLDKPKKADFVEGELLVRFRPGTGMARTKSRASLHVSTSNGRSLEIEVNHFGGSEIVEGLMLARVPAEDTVGALKALRARADVAYVEPNFIRHADAVPNDTRYADLWGLQNAPGGGISAESAWNTTPGNHNVVVGVVDSGIDIEHHDLKDNIFVNTAEIPNNSIDDDNNGFVDDVNGWDFANHDRTVFDSATEDFHGTHVAGTIGARGNNAAGVVGVNWDVQLMPLKAIGALGGTDATLLEAFSYARTMRQRGVNLRVLNNSYGGQRFSQSLLDAIKQLNEAGILFVASAGNEALNNDFVRHFPASYDAPNVISVAASAEGSFFTIFSNWGPQSVHLLAPGQNILSTTPRGYSDEGLVAAYTEADGSTYSRFSGTSMATPHVVGTAALACAANPGVSVEKLRAALLSGVDQNLNFDNRVITSGFLNANKTIQLALASDTTAPAVPADFKINSQIGRRIGLKWFEAGDDGTTGRASLNEVRFTDSVSQKQFRLHIERASDPLADRTVFVSIPIQHSSGQLSLRTFDDAGNSTTATTNVSIAPEVADPYIVTVGPSAPLTPQNSGTVIGPVGDDVLTNGISLPFPFPFFGSVINNVVPSSNGALYIPIPPEFALPRPSFGPADFAVATNSNLESLAMVAGMWADLRTDRRAGDNVYMVQLDPDRVAFRWQAVTFGSETPVNFEIELRRDGTIITRYGDGNANLRPVIVGISAGDPDAYLIGSHSSESAQLSLTNAQSVTFALKNPPPPPTTDLDVNLNSTPSPILNNQNVSYKLRVRNLGPDMARNLVMTSVLPAGTTFVSCGSDHFGTCTASGSTVTGRIDTLQPTHSDAGVNFTIVVNVTAAPGTFLQSTASATNFRPDPNPSNNSATISDLVVAQTFLSGVSGVSAGNMHTASVRNDGTVWTWGLGSQGQLADGNLGFGVRAVTPIPVSGLQGVTTVADGNGFVMALKSDGTVWTWGTNGNGQLGDGNVNTNRSAAGQVVGLTNVKAIAAGDFFSAAVKTDGTVWVWGAAGSLLSTNFENKPTPVQVPGISDVAAVAGGGQHLLMLKNDKTLWSIGGNQMGQLGDGTSTPRQTPVQVNNLSNVKRIAAGSEFSLALKEDGTVWAWGFNFNGQLGPGGGNPNFDPHPNPIQVTGLPAGMIELAAGMRFCLAVAGDGTVWSWGDNSNFQLGQGFQVSNNSTPKQIPNFGSVVAVDGGNTHSVALKADGSVWCWGSNSEGECGDGLTTQRLTPGQVVGLEVVSTPSFSPAEGSFQDPVDVTITCSTPGAIIHYTTNGLEPTQSDPVITSGSTLRLFNFAFLQARAWKPGLVPSSPRTGFFHVQTKPPQLVLDESGPASDQVAALDSMLLVRDPFPVINPANLLKNPNDPNTRVTVFVRNFQLSPGESASVLNIELISATGIIYNFTAEAVRSVPNVDFVEVAFRLPNNLAPGTCQVRVSVRAFASNTGSIRIKL